MICRPFTGSGKFKTFIVKIVIVVLLGLLVLAPQYATSSFEKVCLHRVKDSALGVLAPGDRHRRKLAPNFWDLPRNRNRLAKAQIRYSILSWQTQGHDA